MHPKFDLISFVGGVGLGVVLAIICVPGFAQAQSKEQQLPTGKQYCIGQLAAAEAKVLDMLDEISNLRRQIDVLTKKEKPKE